MRKQYTSEERSELVDLVVGGRATVAEAAAQVGVTPVTAYAWLKRSGARRGRAERPGRSGSPRSSISPSTFVRVLRAGDVAAVAATMEVRIGNAEIHVRRGFDVELLRAVVGALQGDVA